MFSLDKLSINDEYRGMFLMLSKEKKKSSECTRRIRNVDISPRILRIRRVCTAIVCSSQCSVTINQAKRKTTTTTTTMLITTTITTIKYIWQFLGHDKYEGYPYRALMGPRWNFAGKLAIKKNKTETKTKTRKHATFSQTHTHMYIHTTCDSLEMALFRFVSITYRYLFFQLLCHFSFTFLHTLWLIDTLDTR